MKDMNPITSLTEQEIHAFAEAFADYGYDKSTGERGLVYLFSERERLLGYLSAMIRSALSCGMVYATSDRHEGIVILTDTTHPIPFVPMMKLFCAMIRALTLKAF